MCRAAATKISTLCRSNSIVLPRGLDRQMPQMQSFNASSSMQFEHCKQKQGGYKSEMPQIQACDVSSSMQLEHCKQKQDGYKSAAFALLDDPDRWKYLDQWTSDDVASWLFTIGLDKCAAQVRSHDIAGDVAGDVTLEDAKDMGLREIDAYRLIRALAELQVLVNEVWRRPNQLSDRLKIDSLQHHHAKLSQKKMKTNTPRDINYVRQDLVEDHGSKSQTKAHCTDQTATCPSKQVPGPVLRRWHRDVEANCAAGKVTSAPQSPETPLQLPIKKRVRFNDQVEHM